MAIGGNIKVTLTLDDAGFTVKSQQAASGIKNMNSEIKGFTGGLEKAETSIKRFGERVQTVSKEFTALNNYAKAASKTLNQLATSNENLDRTTGPERFVRQPASDGGAVRHPTGRRNRQHR